MSGFDLVPVDGGDPVRLAPGETVLGRGPLLGVSDKRVSRHHGLLENLDGRLRLKPTHLNPCFVQPSLVAEPQPLQKDSWHPLHHGDMFSLLPGQFIFRVVAVGGEHCTPRNSHVLEDEKDEIPVSPKRDAGPAPAVGQDHGPSSPQGEQTSAAWSHEEEANSCVTSFSKGHSAQPRALQDGRCHVSPPVPRKRDLPAWMMLAVGPPKNPSPSAKVQSVKRSKTPSTSSKHTPGLREEEEERPRKRRRKRSDEETAKYKADLPLGEPTARNQSGASRSEVSDESDNVAMEVEEEGGGNTATQMSGISNSEGEDRTVKPGPQTSKPQQSWSSGDSASALAPSKPRLRAPCPYGKDCYRKNPIHFQECSHPGDTDYEEEEDEGAEEADRPECPYGTDCYRKNPLHTKEYKHTKKPARATRTGPKQVAADNEDDYDDSFIDDDSEDVGNDSDYVPPDSGDSDKEDIRRLQREAKEFLKKRT